MNKKPSGDQKNPPSTDEATVCVNDLDFLLLADSQAVLSLSSFCQEMGHSYEWKRRESPSLIENGSVINWKSENHVPIVVVSKDVRISDDPSSSLGDRLQIPGAKNQEAGREKFFDPIFKAGEPRPAMNRPTAFPRCEGTRRPFVYVSSCKSSCRQIKNQVVFIQITLWSSLELVETYVHVPKNCRKRCSQDQRRYFYSAVSTVFQKSGESNGMLVSFAEHTRQTVKQKVTV